MEIKYLSLSVLFGVLLGVIVHCSIIDASMGFLMTPVAAVSYLLISQKITKGKLVF